VPQASEALAAVPAERTFVGRKECPDPALFGLPEPFFGSWCVWVAFRLVVVVIRSITTWWLMRGLARQLVEM
jgi:hypothetical protein